MKPSVRNLVLLCAAGSLLMCTAAGALWLRSLSTGDMVACNRTHLLVLQSDAGLIRLYISPADPAEKPGFRYESWRRSPSDSAWRWQGRRWWHRMGFGHYIGGSRTGQRVDQYVFPHYGVVCLTAILPAVVVVRWFALRRRRRRGHCPRCGYDLRATPERCPECGHAA